MILPNDRGQRGQDYECPNNAPHNKYPPQPGAMLAGQARSDADLSDIAGPAEAIAWGQLMQDNDGATVMAACRKPKQQDADGRHYCFMPVWTDTISSAVPSASAQ